MICEVRVELGNRLPYLGGEAESGEAGKDGRYGITTNWLSIHLSGLPLSFGSSFVIKPIVIHYH